MKKYRVYVWLSLAVGVILLDQISKQVIANHFLCGAPLELSNWQEQICRSSIKLTSFLNITFVINKGAAFGFLSTHPGWQRWFFIVLAIVICGYLLRLMFQQRHDNLFLATGSLIIGGALGNVIDRMRYGGVIDFIDVHINTTHWPAFNVADSAICIGVALMLLSQWRDASRQKNSSPTSHTASDKGLPDDSAH